MLRVLRIIQSSSFAQELQNEQVDIINWIASLLNNVWQYQQPDGYLLNYMDQQPSSTFIDASGTALLAAATFRLATIAPGQANTVAAEKARSWIAANIGKDGWLTHVVNPLNWHVAGSHSPEGQAFVLMLDAAYQNYLHRK
jgi:rhamnogalacturonyl hydrolase YesR